jgi:Ca-activated chloride channel family protein
MNFKNLVGFFILLWIFPIVVNADGIIIPDPIPDIIPYPELAIRYHHVSVNIDNQYASTEIDQVFENEYSRDLEGTYIFPLPEGASISKFSMWVDGEELSGEILEKEKARKIYEDIVRRMQDPALLEYFDRGMFKARVYPIPAHGEKRISLAYSEIITCEFGVCRYVYPLETEKFSSKPLKDVVISVRLKSNTPIRAVYSPTHEISIKRLSDYEVEVSYEVENVKPEKDFELYYTLSEEDFGLNLLTFRENAEKTGFFLLFLTPKYETEKSEIIAKDIVFVIDTSGSMSGEKIEQAKRALKFYINNLNEKDNFDIITFNTNIEKFSDELIKATSENLEKAIKFTDKISASGGTNIHDALIEALQMLDEENNGRTDILIFLTDGKPTVGVTDTEKILNSIVKQNTKNTRIFVFGVGYEVNTHLLDRISGKNKGVSEYVKPEEDLEVKVSNFYEKISNPVLSDLEIDFGEIKVKDIYPKKLPDLFKGSQLIIFGRYSNDGDIKITLTGKVGSEEKTYEYFAQFPRKNLRNDFIPRLWATRKIGFLLDEIRLHGENKELVDEIINLSLTYGIMTPYTSFLVEVDTDLGRPIAPAEELRENFLESLTKNLFRASSGKEAIKSAETTQYMRDKTRYDSGSERVKSVDTKTFYLKGDGFWVDNAYSEDFEVMKVKYGSDLYFNLLFQNSKVGKYFALGKNVRFCLDGTCYEIGDEGGGTPQITTTTTTLGGSTKVTTTTTTYPSITSPQEPTDTLILTLVIIGLVLAISIGVIFVGRRE